MSSSRPTSPSAAAAATASDAATTALTNVLGQLLTWLNTAGAAPSTSTAAAPKVIYDLYDDTNPFNLATRIGMTAFEKSCEPLPIIWDGTVEKFPPFILSLTNRFEKFGWNATGDSGIATVAGKELLQNYHSITSAEIETAFNNTTNERAKQNNRALSETLESSVTGNVKTALFDTSSAKPRKNDGRDHFHKLTKLTTLASIQTSIAATHKLTTYCPSSDDFNIADVNKTINHLLILATTSNRKFEDLERIQILMTAYDRIRQPAEWSNWVHQKKTEYNDGKITKANDFQTEALVRQNQIIDESDDKKFKGSLQSIQEEIVSMVADLRSNNRTAGKRKPSERPTTPKEDEDEPRPKFLKWTSTKQKGGTAFKVGDTKKSGDTVYHFCDCPWHKNGVHWHPFSAADCRTRKRWMAREGKTDTRDATANAATAETPEENETPTQVADNTEKIKNITTMLGDVMQAMEDSGASASVPQALLADVATLVSDLS